MDLGLDGKTVFISGASRGIGLAIAQAFVGEGARVVITARNADRLEAVATELGGSAFPLVADMTDPAQIEEAFARALDRFDVVDAVVPNLGRGRSPSGWDVDTADWRAALDVNLFASIELARVALRYLVSRETGSLTFVSSIAGREAIGAPLAYAAAKAALDSAMKGMARLVGASGVRVNAVAPGNVLFPGGRWEDRLEEERNEVETYIARAVPLQRFGRPEEIADAVLFLTSERAAFITGATVVVDGGQSQCS